MTFDILKIMADARLTRRIHPDDWAYVKRVRRAFKSQVQADINDLEIDILFRRITIMTPLDNPAEALTSVQDSIRSAESVYSIYEDGIVFATEKQVMGINIAIERILKAHGIGRNDRVETLRILFSRQPGRFTSSKHMTMKGAGALRDRLYGPDAFVDRDTPILPDAILAVTEAYRQAVGQYVLI